jgi:hypothetical protein
VTAGVTLNWRGDSSRGQVKLADLNLAPYSTQQLPIGAMQKQLVIPDDAHWALVTLSTPASPNDLVAVASSYDASGRYNIDTPFSSNVAGHFAGGEWRADFNHNQLMAVTNSGQKPTNALLTLHYDNGQKSYKMQQSIQPGDQMWVNVASLIRSRTPDRKGNVLPADATSGTYDLRDLSPGLGSLTQDNLALDGTFGLNLKHPNAICCGTSNPGWDPLAVLFFGSEGIVTDIEGTDQCNGDGLNITDDFYTFGSANPSIATVTSKQVTPVAAGTTTGSASGSVMMGVGSYCAYDPVNLSLPITVQVPTSLKMVSATILQTGNSGNHGCTSGYYGIGIDVDYQVLDQNSNPIHSSAMTPQEYIVWYDGSNNGGFTNIGPTYVSTTSQTTRTDGTFDDAPVHLCKAVPFTTPLTSTQTIQIVFNGQAYPVRTNNWQFSSTNLTNHGTVTNGADISKTQ